MTITNCKDSINVCGKDHMFMPCWTTLFCFGLCLLEYYFSIYFFDTRGMDVDGAQIIVTMYLIYG